MAGITIAGFVGKSLQECKTELEARFRAAFGNGIDLSPQSNFGQLVGILAEREADLWALAEAVNAARQPDNATGVNLDEVAGITGTVRAPGTPTTLTLFLTGDDATAIPLGQVILSSAGLRFLTTENATLAAPAFAFQWESLGDDDTVTAGDFYHVDDGGTDRIYRVVTTGEVGNPKETPTGTAASITVGTAVVTYVGDGEAVASAEAESEDLGPVPAPAREVNEIATPLAGWSAAINLADGVLGEALESDAALRVRREEELRANGAASVEAVRSAVLAVDGVQSCTVFENVSNVTDADGVPAHAIETVVLGGEDAAVAAAIFAAKAAGILAHGTSTETITDSEDIDHEIGFTRPSELEIWIDIALKVDPRTFPIDGNNQVRAAIKAYGDAQRTGKDVVAAAISAQAFKVAGVLDVLHCWISTSDPATVSTTIAVSLRELAVFDLTRMDVDSTVTGAP